MTQQENSHPSISVSGSLSIPVCISKYVLGWYLLIVFKSQREKERHIKHPKPPDAWPVLIGYVRVCGTAMRRDWVKGSISTDFHKVESGPCILFFLMLWACHLPPGPASAETLAFFKENWCSSSSGAWQVVPNGATHFTGHWAAIL